MQQGVADKGKALFENVRDRITKKISVVSDVSPIGIPYTQYPTTRYDCMREERTVIDNIGAVLLLV
jgi:hypothetical protein